MYFDFQTPDTSMFELDGTSAHVLIMETGLYIVLMSSTLEDPSIAASTVSTLDSSFGSGATKTYLQLTSSQGDKDTGHAAGAQTVWNNQQWFLVSVTAVTSGLKCEPSLTLNPANTGLTADHYVFIAKIDDAYTTGL